MDMCLPLIKGPKQEGIKKVCLEYNTSLNEIGPYSQVDKHQMLHSIHGNNVTTKGQS